MKRFKQGTGRQLFLSMITNPIFIIVYWVSFYELFTLCKYGRIHNNVIILIICMLFFLVWVIILISRIIKSKTQDNNIMAEGSENSSYSYRGTISIICR